VDSKRPIILGVNLGKGGYVVRHPTTLRNFGDAKPEFSTILKVFKALKIKLHASVGGEP